MTDLRLSFADYKEFTQLLDQQATIDQYAEWASNLVNRCVLKVSMAKSKLHRKHTQILYLMWKYTQPAPSLLKKDRNVKPNSLWTVQ